MDGATLSSLRQKIQANRSSFPFLASYLGMWGMKQRCVLEKRQGNDDPALNAFEEDLETYISEGGKWLAAEVLDPKKENFLPFAQYSMDAVFDNDNEEKDTLLQAFLKYEENAKDLGNREKILLYYLIVAAYRRIARPWRGKAKAAALLELLEKEDTARDVYEELAAFYKGVLDYASAVKAYLLGAKTLKAMGLEKEAALLYRDALTAAICLPGYEFPSEKEIRDMFPHESETVLSYPKKATFAHDEVEASPRFQAVYDEVMEEAMDAYEKEKGGKTVHMLWAYMAEGFAKRDILWKDPQWMNPSMRFD